MSDVQGMEADMGGGRPAAEDLHSMADMVDQYMTFPNLQRGDLVEGVIVSLRPAEILVDIGGKTEGVVTSRDLERLPPQYLERLQVGDEIVACVVRPSGPDGQVLLSLTRALQEEDWRKAEERRRSGQVFSVRVVDVNRGGLIARMGRLRGFVPASQLGWEHRAPRRRSRGRDDEEDVPWKDLVGERIRVKVLEVDRARTRLILSERAAEKAERAQQKAQLLEELREGDRRRGVVRSLCDFGAFVDLGGADGLVHISELAWKRVQHPSEVVQEGDEVEVYVLDVDRERERIALSLKRLEPEPWSLISQQYEVGQIVEVTITRITEFGAFALLEDGIEGLIHVSELAPYRVEHPRQVVKEGDVVQVRILRIEPERRRLGLSLKEAADDYVEVDWDIAETIDDEDAEEYAVEVDTMVERPASDAEAGAGEG